MDSIEDNANAATNDDDSVHSEYDDNTNLNDDETVKEEEGEEIKIECHEETSGS